MVFRYLYPTKFQWCRMGGYSFVFSLWWCAVQALKMCLYFRPKMRCFIPIKPSSKQWNKKIFGEKNSCGSKAVFRLILHIGKRYSKTNRCGNQTLNGGTLQQSQAGKYSSTLAGNCYYSKMMPHTNCCINNFTDYTVKWCESTGNFTLACLAQWSVSGYIATFGSKLRPRYILDRVSRRHKVVCFLCKQEHIFVAQTPIGSATHHFRKSCVSLSKLYEKNLVSLSVNRRPLCTDPLWFS